MTILIVCIVIFTLGEFAKASIASKQHIKYLDDFEWVKSNTPKDSIFYPFVHGLVYNLDRYVINDYSSTDYYFEQYSHKLEPLSLNVIEENFDLVDDSLYTDVKVYKSINNKNI
ncbi:MAG: hypothetical protein KAU20_01515 [Nanoarchaeota archaeon]|nr:hypothetical protein [Nanoarchaeota archaeon]